MALLNKHYPQRDIDVLLAKYVTGRADSGSHAIIEAWVAANEQNSNEAKRAELIWNKSSDLGFTGTLDVEGAWEDFKERIDFKAGAVIMQNRFPWRRLAAVAFLMIGLGLAFLIFRLGKKNTSTMVEIFSGNDPKKDTLPDRSVVFLEPNSSLSYFSPFAANHRDVRMSGNAFFTVQPDHARPFSVVAGDLKVTVLGTSFRINQKAVPTEISVSTGIVEVSGSKQNAILHAGDKLLVPIKDSPWVVKSTDTSSSSVQAEKKPLTQSIAKRESRIQGASPPHALLVGDRAPILPMDTWIKGGPINIYQEGKVYLIDFWAIWCGPCIAEMGHLSELQQKYKNQGLEVIGATSEDSWGNTHDKVMEFIRDKGQKFDYNFVWMPDSYRADHRYRSVIYNPWLELAYDSSSWALPQVFILDRDGKMAFIGDGYSLNENFLARVLNGSYDTAAERKKYLEKIDMENQVAVFVDLLNRKEVDRAMHVGQVIVQNHETTSHGFMTMADAIFNSHNDLRTPELLKLGMDAAIKGVESTASRSPGHLALLARGYALTGKPEKAVAILKPAIEMAEGSFKEALEKDLRTYQGMIKK
ncbi:MAG TPA: FecR domain-containing protein [Puia sp.]|nr:FecR domain-containing protein [Puia sp.]